MAIIAGLTFNKPLEILVHDTYIILSSIEISILISLILFVSGLGYFIYRNRAMNANLTQAHKWLSIAGVIVLLTLIILQYLVNGDSHNDEFVEYENMEKSIQIALSN